MRETIIVSSGHPLFMQKEFKGVWNVQSIRRWCKKQNEAEHNHDFYFHIFLGRWSGVIITQYGENGTGYVSVTKISRKETI